MVQDKQRRVTLIRFVITCVSAAAVRPRTSGKGGGRRGSGLPAGMTLSSIKSASATDAERRADLGGVVHGGTDGGGAVVLAEQPHRSSSSSSRSRSHVRSTLVSLCRRHAPL